MYLIKKTICPGFEKGKAFSAGDVCPYFKVNSNDAQSILGYWIEKKYIKQAPRDYGIKKK